MNKEQTNQPRNGLERGPHFRGPVVKPKNQKQTLKRIWDYVKQQRLQLIGAIFLVILTTVLSLAGPLLIGVIVDDYIITKI